jgi:hypothetical protein
MERLRITSIQVRENLGGHRYGDAGGGPIAEIKSDWSSHLQSKVVIQPSAKRVNFFEQPLASMRGPERADVRHLSLGQQRQHLGIVLEAVRHQYNCCA